MPAATTKVSIIYYSQTGTVDAMAHRLAATAEKLCADVRLDADAAERALVEPALDLQVHWDTDAAELAVQQAGGSPYLIQLIGEESWIQAHPDAGSSIGLQHVEAAAGEVGESLDNGMFRGRWAKAIPVEKAVIVDRRHRRRGRSCLDWGHLDCLGRAGSAVEHGASVADRQGHDRARRSRSAQVHDAGGLRRSWRRSAPRGRASPATWRVPCASDSHSGPQR